jgi:DNA-binding beta-propeller fold protein YncE
VQPFAAVLRSLAVIAVWLALPSAAAAQTVSTLAGSGRPGFADGAAAEATFLFPSAVAVGPQGDVYVADGAAQRVRVVSAGAVRTLAGSGPSDPRAGWVAPGFVDGPGVRAQLSVPLGIAVGPDGDAYVADAGNSAIRRIAADGTVTTFARGLSRPHQLAFDREGRLYVADGALGIVRIDPGGTRTTLALDVTTPYGVAVFESGSSLTLFVADDRGVMMARGGEVLRIDRVDRMTRTSATTEGEEQLGTPYQLAALGESTVAFSDVHDEAVRLLRFEPGVFMHGNLAAPANGAMHRAVVGSVTPIAGTELRDGSMNGGGFADGNAALFDAPMGIATTPAGDLVVADAGNRRVRMIRGIDLGRPVLDDGALPPARDATGAYRILYTGASGVWWDTTWDASIPGTIERDLAAASQTPRGLEVLPARLIGAGLPGEASYLDTVADTRTVDAVVLDVNAGSVGGDDSDRWIVPAAKVLRALRDRLARAHLPLLLVLEPTPFELGDGERTWRRIVEDGFAPGLLGDEDRWLTAARQAGVETVDLFPLFRDDINSPSHRPLFGSDEAHLTAYGRALAGHAIAAALARQRPWNAAPR